MRFWDLKNEIMRHKLFELHFFSIRFEFATNQMNPIFCDLKKEELNEFFVWFWVSRRHHLNQVISSLLFEHIVSNNRRFFSHSDNL